MRRRTFLKGTAAAALLGPRALDAALPREELLLRGAAVYDGTGAPPVEADVLVRGGRIAAVGGRLSGADAARLVDLRGLALAPGFIDIHGHSDLGLLVDPRAHSKVRQGVTTDVAGQDGGSIGPWSDARYEEVRASYADRYGVEIDFRDLRGFFARIERQGAALNLASMVGAGTVRGFVVGADDRPPTAAELARMAALVEDALAAGACGVSSGLEYAPGAFAALDELVALARPAAARGLPYASHMRNEDDELLAALEEALQVGRRSGAPVQVSHLKAQGRRNWWKAEPALRLLEAARADGLDVAYDRYPYVAYSTGLSNLFPVWAQDGGTDAFLARLADAAQRPRLEAAVRDKIDELGGWDAVQISSTAAEALSWARGQRLGTLAAARAAEPYELLVRLLVDDRAETGMVGFAMSEENTARFLAHPLGMVCSDGGARATTGPLAAGTPHPRSYGAFPRVLGHYVRERGLMPLETAIHKMTGMPAARLRLLDRGRIAPGMRADLVAFDPRTVADVATFERPHAYPVGIPHVWVAGRFVIRDGEHTGELPGRVARPFPTHDR